MKSHKYFNFFFLFSHFSKNKIYLYTCIRVIQSPLWGGCNGHGSNSWWFYSNTIAAARRQIDWFWIWFWWRFGLSRLNRHSCGFRTIPPWVPVTQYRPPVLVWAKNLFLNTYGCLNIRKWINLSCIHWNNRSTYTGQVQLRTLQQPFYVKKSKNINSMRMKHCFSSKLFKRVTHKLSSFMIYLC